MSRMVSFVILIITILAMATAFVLVMAQFLLPMFLAVLLVVVFRPLHEWFLKKCQGRNRIAAGLTTLSIVLIVLVPLLLIMFEAAREGAALTKNIDQEWLRESVVAKTGHLIDQARDVVKPFRIEIPPNQELVQSSIHYLEGLIAPA